MFNTKRSNIARNLVIYEDIELFFLTRFHGIFINYIPSAKRTSKGNEGLQLISEGETKRHWCEFQANTSVVASAMPCDRVSIITQGQKSNRDKNSFLHVYRIPVKNNGFSAHQRRFELNFFLEHIQPITEIVRHSVWEIGITTFLVYEAENWGEKIAI